MTVHRWARDDDEDADDFIAQINQGTDVGGQGGVCVSGRAKAVN